MFLEAERGGQPLGELLRREGLYSSDLARIRDHVKEGALERLRARPGPKPQTVGLDEYTALKQELEAKERAMADHERGTGDPAKKNDWGYVGPITGEWLAAETKMEMLDLIDESTGQGVSCRRSCTLLMMHRSRILRWQQTRRSGGRLENGTPGPEQPLHRLLPEERETMVALARREDLADLSHRELTVTAWDKGLVYISFSTTYRVLQEAGLMGMRGKGSSS